MDVERAAQGQAPVDADHVPERDILARTGLSIMIAPGLVYLCQVVIVWHGEVARIRPQPWIAISLVGLGVWLVGRHRERALRA